MTQRTERLLWAVASLCAIIAIIIWRHPIRGIPMRNAHFLPAPTPVTMFDGDTLTAASARTAAHDPFRIDRRPSDIAFGNPAASAATAPQPPSLQGLSLKGVVGGPPWQAVLAGVPGRPGNVVVHAGDTLAGVRVRRIQRDGVVLAGTDSLITLTLQRAWQ